MEDPRHSDHSQADANRIKRPLLYSHYSTDNTQPRLPRESHGNSLLSGALDEDYGNYTIQRLGPFQTQPPASESAPRSSVYPIRTPEDLRALYHPPDVSNAIKAPVLSEEDWVPLKHIMISLSKERPYWEVKEILEQNYDFKASSVFLVLHKSLASSN